MEKRFAIILVLIVLVALSVSNICPIRAQLLNKGITIDVDGKVTPSTAPIQQTGNTYTLTNNINGSITVNRNNIVFNGNGHVLYGQGYTSSGYLQLNQTSSVTVENLVIQYSADTGPQEIGLYLADTSNSVIINDTVAGFESEQAWNGGTYAAISVEGGASNTIAGNSFKCNLFGIFFSDTHYNKVIGNNIVGDTNVSLFATGLYFSNASENTIYHNNIINNSIQVDTSTSINIWDNGYPSGGNFWSDYWTKDPSAAQINNSGLLNTPYTINSQNKDRFPLAKPFNNLSYQEIVPPAIFILSPLDQKYNESSIPLVFTVDKAVDWLGYTLDGKQNLTVRGNSTIVDLSNGSHTIVVYANDTFGNIGASDKVNFAVASPKQMVLSTISVIAISVALSLVVAGVGLIIYVKKRKRTDYVNPL